MASPSKCSASTSVTQNRLCGCGDAIVLFQSRRKETFGKKFWRCPNWRKKSSCNFFEWVENDYENENEDEHGPKNTRNWHESEVVLEDSRRKIGKLKMKLAAERRKGHRLVAVVILSWVVTFSLCLYCIVKCNCQF